MTYAPHANLALHHTHLAYGAPMKRRSPLAAWIGLPLITLGIYYFVWYYKIHKEMAMFRGDPNQPTAGPVLVMIFLSWTIIAPLVSFYNTGTRIREAQRAAGLQPSCIPILGMIGYVVLGIGVFYYQHELNLITPKR